jgi:hypothetical protein
MFRLVVVAALTTAMVACQSDVPAHTDTSDLGCGTVTAAVQAMHENLTLPPYFSEPNAVKRGGEFDANRIFEALPHLKMRDGFTLDYVYHQDRMGGYPKLYVRPVAQPPYVNEAAFEAAVAKPPDYLTFVTPRDSPEGYFEFAVLAMTANQFYLDWHANYNDWQVVCGSDGVEKIIGDLNGETPFDKPMTAEQQQAARVIPEPQPSVTMTDETATVTMLVFSKWDGLKRRTLTIDRNDHSIRDERDEPLVEYDCGVRF